MKMDDFDNIALGVKLKSTVDGKIDKVPKFFVCNWKPLQMRKLVKYWSFRSLMWEQIHRKLQYFFNFPICSGFQLYTEHFSTLPISPSVVLFNCTQKTSVLYKLSHLQCFSIQIKKKSVFSNSCNFLFLIENHCRWELREWAPAQRHHPGSPWF